MRSNVTERALSTTHQSAHQSLDGSSIHCRPDADNKNDNKPVATRCIARSVSFRPPSPC